MNSPYHHKITSIGLAFLVMLSTLSFTIEKHFCGDTLIDVAVFSEVQKCGMEMAVNKTPVKKPCCKDEVQLVKGQDDLKLNTDEDVSVFQVVFLTALIHTSISNFESLSKKTDSHQYYSPPEIIKDIHVLDEVYLI